MDNMILLYIDNCEQALNEALGVVSACEGNLIHLSRDMESWVKNFGAVSLSLAGDKEQARLLRRELNTLGSNDTPAYWQDVARHYLTKFQERAERAR